MNVNWKFWQRPAESKEEEDDMGLYLRREETPAEAWQHVLGQANDYPDEEETPAAAEEGPPEDEDPLATAAPEIQAAVEARLTQQRQQIRANLVRHTGIDLTEDNLPAQRDARRAQEWIGAPQYQAPAPAQPQQSAAKPPAEPAEDEPIPDPQYDPAGFKRWQTQEMARLTAQAVQSALAPFVEQLQRVEHRTKESHIDTAMGRLDAAIQQYAPWLEGALAHPEFEPMLRRGLASIAPEQYGSLQELAGLASYAATQLPPLETPYQPPQRAFRPQAAPQQPPAAPPRNEQGQFVGQRAGQNVGRAAIGRAAAEATAPSRGGGRVPVQQQYEELVIQAAARLGISPEEARLTLQDSTGDASEQLRRQRLEKLK